MPRQEPPRVQFLDQRKNAEKNEGEARRSALKKANESIIEVREKSPAASEGSVREVIAKEKTKDPPEESKSKDPPRAPHKGGKGKNQKGKGKGWWSKKKKRNQDKRWS